VLRVICVPHLEGERTDEERRGKKRMREELENKSEEETIGRK
jgi:hypothetical protein